MFPQVKKISYVSPEKIPYGSLKNPLRVPDNLPQISHKSFNFFPQVPAKFPSSHKSQTSHRFPLSLLDQSTAAAATSKQSRLPSVPTLYQDQKVHHMFPYHTRIKKHIKCLHTWIQKRIKCLLTWTQKHIKRLQNSRLTQRPKLSSSLALISPAQAPAPTR